MKKLILTAAFGLLTAIGIVQPAQAKETQVGSLKIEHGFAIETRPGQPNGAAFVDVANRGKQADRLLSVSFDKAVAERGELHTMKHEGGKMIMREVPKFEIQAGGKLALKPGADHLMMIGIKEPLKAGQTIKATLKFENAGTVVVDLKVKAMSDVHKHGHDDHHHNGQHHDGHHGKPAKH